MFRNCGRSAGGPSNSACHLCAIDPFRRVLLQLANGHRAPLKLAVVPGVGLPRSTLVPLHDREVLLPRSLDRARQRNERSAGAAMYEEQQGVLRVLAAHVNPLIQSADAHRLQAVDAVG